MKIKSKLSLQFTLIVTGIILFFSSLVYYFSYTSQLTRFNENLLNSAKNTAILLINVVEVDSTLLKKIQRSTISLEKEEIAITDSSGKLIYSNNIHYLSEDVIRQNSGFTSVNFFSIAEKNGVCYQHKFHNHTYNVMVMAFDSSRKINLAELRTILYWCIFFSIWLSVLLSYFFSKKAMKPISDIIKNVKAINSSKLSNRLNEGNKKDEISQLAITFNQMLSNLEIAFKNQEDFVSYASHELRTPLSVMILEADYILSRDSQPDEFKKHIAETISDLKILNSQINSLLELAQLNHEKSINLAPVRIDEIVFSAIQLTKAKYLGRKIIPKIQYPENENELLIKGDFGLLTIAFKNIIDNACKFSSDNVMIEFFILDKGINIIISDKGIGIPANEFNDIFRPFTRASNVKYKSGFGIGLSLVVKILELHKAVININSTENKGTRFELVFEKNL
jgi:two-component system, OmpR family, sensor histidine kinase ArlS